MLCCLYRLLDSPAASVCASMASPRNSGRHIEIDRYASLMYSPLNAVFRDFLEICAWPKLQLAPRRILEEVFGNSSHAVNSARFGQAR